MRKWSVIHPLQVILLLWADNMYIIESSRIAHLLSVESYIHLLVIRHAQSEQPVLPRSVLFSRKTSEIWDRFCVWISTAPPKMLKQECRGGREANFSQLLSTWLTCPFACQASISVTLGTRPFFFSQREGSMGPTNQRMYTYPYEHGKHEERDLCSTLVLQVVTLPALLKLTLQAEGRRCVRVIQIP